MAYIAGMQKILGGLQQFSRGVLTFPVSVLAHARGSLHTPKPPAKSATNINIEFDTVIGIDLS